MQLLIAEKPSVARDIANLLGGAKTKKGYIETNSYTVTYAFGHLVQLADADAYDAKYSKWNKEDLPIMPDTFKLVVGSSGKEQYQIIADLLKQADEVIVATDAGREGQLIYEYIAKKAGYKGPAKRLWVSSLTDEAIVEGLAKLRDNREYQKLHAAAACRSESDWLVGINATRAMTTHTNTLLPIGRVQTPTLAMIVNRDLEIDHFKPVPYYEVMATFQAENGTYQGKWTKEKLTRFDHKEDADQIVAKVKGKPGAITKLETTLKTEQAPQLFDLTTLQRRANQLFAFTADKTLKIAQALYETHKVLTYPRTDSRYISEDIVPTLRARLNAASKKIVTIIPFFQNIQTPGKRVVDNKKVSDHHAIIPTEKAATSLSDDELKVYELVVKQTIAALLPSAQWENTIIETNVEGENFRTTGRVLKDPGWRVVMSEESIDDKETEEDENANLPKVQLHENVKTHTAETKSKQTKPPARYNEASLLGAMENAGKQVDKEELAEAMKERGLGTPATRAATFEKLKKDNYIQVEKKNLVSTQKGRDLIAAINVQELKSPELTGEWEYKLKQMEQGQYDPQTFMNEIRTFTHNIIGQLTSQTVTIAQAEKENLGNCPLCGQPIVESPKAFGCSGWKAGCKFTIWKEISGHKMSPAQVRELLAKKKTKPLKFKSKQGKDFEAHLIIKDGKIEMEFPAKK